MSFDLDRASLLVGVPGEATLAAIEAALAPAGLTLGVEAAQVDAAPAVGDWLAAGAPGAAHALVDPANHLVAGLTAVLAGGQRLEIRPGPRRSVGPDLVALFAGARERFGAIEHVWLRVHVAGAPRVHVPAPAVDLDPPVSPAEEALLAAIAARLAAIGDDR